MNLYRKIRAALREQAYYIGFLTDAEMDMQGMERFNHIHWLNLGHYKEGWFADPFFLSVEKERINLLVEEWEYKKGKGRLCKLNIKRNGAEFYLEDIVPILELDTHLSFPIPLETNGKLYIYPENYESGCLKIYEYDRISDKLINSVTIIDEPLLDTQILFKDGSYYAMGVLYKKGDQSDTKTLRIYKSDNILGPFTLIQELVNNKCEERGAGLIYMEGDKLIRPVQCCEGDYGLAVILKELSIVNDKVTEIEIDRIKPIDTSRYGKGLHTLNKMNGLTVIDGRDFRCYPIANILKRIF